MTKLVLENLCVEFPIYQAETTPSWFKRVTGRGLRKSKYQALKNINLHFSKGDRVALLGKNGAGKSTLLKVMAGLLPPSAGSIHTEGKVFPALTPAPGVLVGASCRQNIILQGLSYGLKGQELTAYIEKVSEVSDLGDFLNSPIHTLSAGMRSRFSVSTLNCMQPDLLLLDEWIGAADRRVLERHNGLLRELVEQSNIFVIASHRKDIVSNFCKTAVVLDQGEIVFHGSVEEGLRLAI